MNNNWELVRFCVTYMGKKPIYTDSIVSMFAPIMTCAHEQHAKIKFAINLGCGAPERNQYDLEYAYLYDGDKAYWEKAIAWWMEKFELKVEIKPYIY